MILRLHHFDESEHLVRSFVGITLILIRYWIVWLKIFAPKLVDLKAALVHVKMDIALFKIGGTSLPNLGFGVLYFR